MSNTTNRKVTKEKDYKAKGNLSGSVFWIFREAVEEEDELRKAAE